MIKDFDAWNEQKKNIESVTKKLLFKEADIWWSSLGINVKSEACGKWDNFRRPVLILKKLSSDTCIVIPLSTKQKEGSWFANYDLHWINYTALLYQIKMIHTNRLTVRIGELDSKDFWEIKKRLKNLLNL